ASLYIITRGGCTLRREAAFQSRRRHLASQDSTHGAHAGGLQSSFSVDYLNGCGASEATSSEEIQSYLSAWRELVVNEDLLQWWNECCLLKKILLKIVI
ncbi:hypothetical protein BOTBODRAFT_640384, partial [Botryobasidium botryosum FD-172 SS1]